MQVDFLCTCTRLSLPYYAGSVIFVERLKGCLLVMDLLDALRKFREERTTVSRPVTPVHKRNSQFAVLHTTDFKMYSGACRIWQYNVGSNLHHIDQMCGELDVNFNLMNSKTPHGSTIPGIVWEINYLQKRVDSVLTSSEVMDGSELRTLVRCLDSVAIPMDDSCVKASKAATIMKDCGQSVKKSLARLQREINKERAISETSISRAKFTGGKAGRKSQFSSRPYHGQLRGRKSQQCLRTSTVSALAKKTRSKGITKVLGRKSKRATNGGRRKRRKTRRSNSNTDDEDGDDAESDSESNSGAQSNRGSHGEAQGNTEVEESVDEPVYCICRQVSYGQMICCDNEKCEMEWFHFKCVHLATKPKGKWYCPSCRDGRANRCRFNVKT
ncbi:PHD-finger [Trichuris suis]|nr:PHD-finger [Trichuris suis]